MALPNWQRTITTTTGDVVPGAEVEVVNETTGLTADIYTSRAGTSAKSNPFFADSTGFAEFYADPGEYRITATGAAGSQTWRYEVLTGTAAMMTNSAGGDSLRSAALMANDTGKGSVYNAVASSLGTLSVEPDVFIPFSDSVELERGYGNRDANGNRAVDFSRASGSQYVNKSGEMKQLASDEPAITSDGIGIFGAFTNELLHSEDVSSWDVGQVNSVSQDGTLSSDGVNQAWLVDSGGESVRAYIHDANPAGKFWLMSVDVKQVDTSYARLQWNEYSGGETKTTSCLFNFSTNEIDRKASEHTNFEKLNDGWYRIYIGNTPNDSGNQLIRFDVAPSNGDNIQGSLYVSKGSIVRNAPKSKIPYVKTESTPVTRAEDIVELPMRGNLPGYGFSFTVSAVCVFGASQNNAWIYDANALGAGHSSLRSAYGHDQLYFSVYGDSYTNSFPPEYLNKKIKLTLRYSSKSKTASVFINGEVLGLERTITPSSQPDFDKKMTIGNRIVGGQAIGEHIKNLKIYHTALTDEQIAALGGPDV